MTATRQAPSRSAAHPATLARLVLFALPGAKISFPAPADVSRICFVLLLCAASQAFPLSSASALERRKSVQNLSI